MSLPAISTFEATASGDLPGSDVGRLPIYSGCFGQLGQLVLDLPGCRVGAFEVLHQLMPEQRELRRAIDGPTSRDFGVQGRDHVAIMVNLP